MTGIIASLSHQIEPIHELYLNRTIGASTIVRPNIEPIHELYLNKDNNTIIIKAKNILNRYMSCI